MSLDEICLNTIISLYDQCDFKAQVIVYIIKHMWFFVILIYLYVVCTIEIASGGERGGVYFA